MVSLYRFGIFLIFYLFAELSSAQLPLHYIEKLDIGKGLSSNEVTDIVQDGNGYLWIATHNGLNRYDGTDVNKFFARTSDNALPGNILSRLLLIDSFHVLIATNHGLSLFDTRRLIFQNISLSQDSIWKNFEDDVIFLEKGSSNDFWIGTPTCIYHLDSQFHILKTFRSTYQREDIGKKRIAFVFNIIPFPTGEVLLRLNLADFLWTPKQDSLINVKTLNDKRWKLLDNRELAGYFLIYNHYLAYDYFNGQYLHIYDPQKDKKYAIKKQNFDPKNISALDDSTIVISYSTGGIQILSFQKKSLKSIDSPYPSVYFPEYVFRKAIKDNEGNLWIATENEGLIKICPTKQYFNEKKLSVGGERKAPYTGTTCFLKDDNIMYVGTYGDGFYEWNLANSNLIRHVLNPKLKGANKQHLNMIWNIRSAGKDTLWVGTQLGLLWYSKKDHTSGRLKQPHPKILDSTVITTQFTDSRGWVWMGLGNGRGLCIFHPDIRSFDVFSIVERGYPFRYPLSVEEDKQSNIWLQNDASPYLATWSKKENQFKKLDIPELRKTTYVFVGRLFLDKKKNTIWYFIQSIGLLQYDIQSGKYKIFGPQNGFNADMVFDISQDNSGLLWLATNQGIFTFDPVKIIFNNFSSSDGLPATYLSGHLFFDSVSNTMYAATPGSVVYFSTKKIVQRRLPLTVRLTQIQENGQIKPIPPNHRIRLAYGTDDFTVSFTAINLTDGAENRYAYKIDKQPWTEVGSQRQIHFAGLSSGDYTLIIKAARRNEEWSPFSESLKFTVVPPFIQTIWFYLVLLIGAISIILIWYGYRLAHLKKIEIMRDRISRDLHDDIGIRLTNIGLMSQMAIHTRINSFGSEPDQRSEISWFEQVREECQVLLQNMREIVWNINPRNDLLEVAIPRMLRFASEMLEAKKIMVLASVSDLKGIRLNMEKRRDLVLIFNEIIHNIIRHSEARQAMIEIRRTHDGLLFSVSDDGKGFEASLPASGNGLQNMEARCKKNRWKFNIESHPGKGTLTKIEIKIT